MKIKTILAALAISILLTAQATAASFNFNTAAAEEMVAACNAEGISLGQDIAQAIVKHREANGPYATEDDLLKVEGLSKALVMQLYPVEINGDLWFDPSSVPGMKGY